MMPDKERRKFPEGGPGRPLGEFLAGPFAVFGRSAIRWINNSGASVIFFFLAFLKIKVPNRMKAIKAIKAINAYDRPATYKATSARQMGEPCLTSG
jgi:hypothetical protein